MSSTPLLDWRLNFRADPVAWLKDKASLVAIGLLAAALTGASFWVMNRSGVGAANGLIGLILVGFVIDHQRLRRENRALKAQLARREKPISR